MWQTIFNFEKSDEHKEVVNGRRKKISKKESNKASSAVMCLESERQLFKSKQKKHQDEIHVPNHKWQLKVVRLIYTCKGCEDEVNHKGHLKGCSKKNLTKLTPQFLFNFSSLKCDRRLRHNFFAR